MKRSNDEAKSSSKCSKAVEVDHEQLAFHQMGEFRIFLIKLSGENRQLPRLYDKECYFQTYQT